MDLFLPKISMGRQSIEADPNRSMSALIGNETGEDNLFSMLMDGIIGGEEGGEETLLEKVSLLVESNPELLEEISKQGTLDIKSINMEDLSKADLKKLLDISDQILDKKAVLDLPEEILANQNMEGKEVSSQKNTTNDGIDNFFKKFFPKSNSESSIEKAAREITLGKGPEVKVSTQEVSQKMAAPAIDVKEGLKKYSSMGGDDELSIIKGMPQIKNEGTSLLNTLSSNMNIDNKIENLGKLNTNSIDLGQVNLGQASDTEVISEIVNHLDKMKLSSAKELNVVVKHNDLGQFQINASEVGKGDVSRLNMEILSNSKDAQAFFKANERTLSNLLMDKGFSLGSLKTGDISSSEFSKGESFNGDDRGFAGGQQRGEGRNQDSQRRAKLWQQYQEKLGA